MASISKADCLLLDSNTATFRSDFYFPQHKQQNARYFCGNSLGLQPKGVAALVDEELEKWRHHGVEGHFYKKNPWKSYEQVVQASSATLVGAKPKEVVVMNSLTVNLHLLMLSFYKPSGRRCKILIESDAFPSDRYAVQSQVRFYGLDASCVVEATPRVGEHLLRTEDIIDLIEQHQDELALVMLSGVNYYTGQLYNMPEITRAGHKAGAKVGFDLAHAAGNVPIQLHDWGVDFAAWCTYKYLNSGPGGVACAFVHDKHHGQAALPRMEGWWGHNPETRFKMPRQFEPAPTAEAWQLSNVPILLLASYRASLDVFEKTSIEKLHQKSRMMTRTLEKLILDFNQEQDKVFINIITPRNEEERGCQLSLVFDKHGRAVHNFLSENGIITDWREPDVVRVAPVPLYNNFEDLYAFYETLHQAVKTL